MVRTTVRLAASAAVMLASLASAQTKTPVAAVDELLAADRAFAAASVGKSPIEAIPPMLAADAWVRGPGGFMRGRDPVVGALKANPDNVNGRLTWRPYRAGISADGLHGFTYGFMTVARPDSTRVQLKYLAYWTRGTEGWRVQVYKRSPRSDGAVPDSMISPALPAKMVAPGTDEAKTATITAELADVERAFSARAGQVGLGAAFKEFGSPDAMNMGSPDDRAFVIGNESISKSVGAGEGPGGSKVTWGPEHTIAASSGDLGVTIGTINAPGPNGAMNKIPFFTIWRRASPSQPWRYVAE